MAGSAYTYAYSTLGEIFAWIIGWDLILEYAMAAGDGGGIMVQISQRFYRSVFGRDYRRPRLVMPRSFSTPGAVMNLPAMVIMVVVTIVLVIGIRESAASNTVLVGVKLGVVLFVIAVGVFFINPANWTGIPADERRQPEEQLVPELVRERYKDMHDGSEAAILLQEQAIATFKMQRAQASGDADASSASRTISARCSRK